MNSRWMKFAFAAGSACIMALSAVAPAQAAVYRGSFDPVYDAGRFGPQLSYRAEATFFVPNACLSGAPVIAATFLTDSSNPCSFGAMTLLTAKVTFYNNVTNATIETVPFPAPYGTDPVVGVWVKYNATSAKNEVVGFSTGLFGNPSSSALGGNTLQMSLYNPIANNPTTYVQLLDTDGLNVTRAGNPATNATISAVPEPSIALASVVGLLSLAGVRLFARRRRAA